MALKLKKVDYVMLFVSDMQKSLNFYRDRLGLETGYQDAHWAELQAEGFKLALHLSDKATPLADHAHVPCVVFAADDIVAQRQELLAMDIQASALIKVAEYGDIIGVSTDFRDPDGNALSLFANLSRAQWEAIHA